MLSAKANHVFFSGYFSRLSHGRKIASIGIFIALSVVVNAFSIDVTATQKISFTYLFCFFTGTVFGPLIGFTVSFLGDLLAFLLPGGGGTYWFLTGVSTGLLAFFPGLFMNAIRFRFKGGVYVKALLSMLAMYLFVTCGIGAYSNYLYVKVMVYNGNYEKAYAVYLAGKIAFSTVVSAINYLLVFLLIPAVNSVKALGIKIQ